MVHYDTVDMTILMMVMVYSDIEDEDIPKLHLLLKRGADPLYLCANGETLFFKAVTKNINKGLKLFPYFIRHVKNINAPLETYLGRTALHLAVDLGNIKILSAVLRKKPDLEVLDENRKTPLHLAIDKRSLPMTEALIKNGASLEFPTLGTSALQVAIRSLSSPEMILLILVNDRNFDVVDSYGLTPMMALLDKYTGSKYDAVQLCKRFLEKGCDPNKRSMDESTSIHYTVRNVEGISKMKHIPLLELLVQHGADLNAQNSSGDTIVHIMAKEWLHIATVSFLFKNRINIELRDQDGKTAMDILAERSNGTVPFRMIIRQLAYREFYGKFVFSDSLKSLISSRPYCERYYESCRKELEEFASLCDLDDVLSKNERQLAQYARNSAFQALNRIDLKKFPIYGADLKMMYKVGEKRRKAEEASHAYLERNVPLNSDCIRKITNMIGTADLEVFKSLVSGTNTASTSTNSMTSARRRHKFELDEPNDPTSRSRIVRFQRNRHQRSSSPYIRMN